MIELSNWVPALTTTTLFGGALWLARSLIITRLSNSVKSEFDRKLAILSSELKTKEAQIESLRSGAMSGLITRQGALYQRKLEAIDQVWSSVKEVEKAKYISKALATLNFEECSKESAKSPKFRSVMETMGGKFIPEDLDLSGAAKARPFITPLAWAYYSTYLSVIMLAVAKMKLLKFGIDSAEKFLKLERADSLLKTVLPSRKEYIEKYGSAVHHQLLDEVEEMLLLELRNIQNGNDADKENARRAADITKEVEKITSSMAEIKAST